MSTLRLNVGASPLRAEHERLLRSALRRGDKDPEGAFENAALEGSYSKRALTIAQNTWKRICARSPCRHTTMQRASKPHYETSCSWAA